MKYDWNDISIIPEAISSISSRKDVDSSYSGKLPLFTAPMDKVIDNTNVEVFEQNNINICLPRHVKYEQLKNDNYFYSYGLDEIIELLDKKTQLPKRVLIDVANGHMKKLYDTAKYIKETFGDKIELMVGNIANPDTYRKYCEIGVDYIRVGIGGGSACTTSANVSIHYPMASLINECAYMKGAYEKPTKIIADGGFRNFSDIIKALALGADYVMLGGVFNKCLESCGDNFLKDSFGDFHIIDNNRANTHFEEGIDVWKYYRGMSTKEVQKSWNKSELKTGEGITKYNKVEYTLEGWCENFTDYLKSAMSYTDSRKLEDFIGEVQWEVISQNSFNRFNK
jgi:NAD(P)H-dependent flavin oxidoreductase YrpB (nitropropane dioxygenase family)